MAPVTVGQHGSQCRARTDILSLLRVVVTQGQGARARSRWYLPDDRGNSRQRAFACTSLVLAARRGQAAEGSGDHAGLQQGEGRNDLGTRRRPVSSSVTSGPVPRRPSRPAPPWSRRLVGFAPRARRPGLAPSSRGCAARHNLSR